MQFAIINDRIVLLLNIINLKKKMLNILVVGEQSFLF